MTSNGECSIRLVAYTDGEEREMLKALSRKLDENPEETIDSGSGEPRKFTDSAYWDDWVLSRSEIFCQGDWKIVFLRAGCGMTALRVFIVTYQNLPQDKKKCKTIVDRLIRAVAIEDKSRHIFIDSKWFLKSRFGHTLLSDNLHTRWSIVRPHSQNAFSRTKTKCKGLVLDTVVDFGTSDDGFTDWQKSIKITLMLEEPTRLTVKHEPFALFTKSADDCRLFMRWQGVELLGLSNKCRWNKLWYFSETAYESHLPCELEHMYRLDKRPKTSAERIILPEISHLTLRHNKSVRFYPDEWQNFRAAFLFILVRCNRAAYIIQRCWRQTICNPEFLMCRRRLSREFNELVKTTPPTK